MQTLQGVLFNRLDAHAANVRGIEPARPVVGWSAGFRCAVAADVNLTRGAGLDLPGTTEPRPAPIPRFLGWSLICGSLVKLASAITSEALGVIDA